MQRRLTDSRTQERSNPSSSTIRRAAAIGAFSMSTLALQGCGNNPSSGIAADAQPRAAAPDAYNSKVPRSREVERLRQIISESKNNDVAKDYIVGMANQRTDAEVVLMIDLASTFRRLGMGGDDIVNALIQIEDPLPEKGFAVKRGPHGFESMGLDTLLKRAEALSGPDSNYRFGHRFDVESSTLFLTMRHAE
ncbi:MAG: hypothetical protein ABIH29_04850 [Candidatus Micrarchaeota archaeon]